MCYDACLVQLYAIMSFVYAIVMNKVVLHANADTGP